MNRRPRKTVKLEGVLILSFPCVGWRFKVGSDIPHLKGQIDFGYRHEIEKSYLYDKLLPNEYKNTVPNSWLK